MTLSKYCKKTDCKFWTLPKKKYKTPIQPCDSEGRTCVHPGRNMARRKSVVLKKTWIDYASNFPITCNDPCDISDRIVDDYLYFAREEAKRVKSENAKNMWKKRAGKVNKQKLKNINIRQYRKLI